MKYNSEFHEKIDTNHSMFIQLIDEMWSVRERPTWYVYRFIAAKLRHKIKTHFITDIITFQIRSKPFWRTSITSADLTYRFCAFGKVHTYKIFTATRDPRKNAQIIDTRQK